MRYHPKCNKMPAIKGQIGPHEYDWRRAFAKGKRGQWLISEARAYGLAYAFQTALVLLANARRAVERPAHEDGPTEAEIVDAITAFLENHAPWPKKAK